MVHPEPSPPAGALEQVRRLAGSSAAIDSVVRLEGGQHAATWRVDTASPALTVVVRQFPVGDSAGACEVRVLRALDGLCAVVHKEATARLADAVAKEQARVLRLGAATRPLTGRIAEVSASLRASARPRPLRQRRARFPARSFGCETSCQGRPLCGEGRGWRSAPAGDHGRPSPTES